MHFQPAVADRSHVSVETRAAAERLGAHALSLEVVEVAALSPGMRRIGLADPLLATITHRPGQDLTFAVPTDAEGCTIKRRYTIRHLDPAAVRADVDVVLHGDGPGARWARDVAPGNRVEAVGPRGKIFVDDDASWHLFVGDESYLPAAFAMTESLPAGATALLVLEHGEDVGELPLSSDAELRGPVWVRHDEAGEGLLDALASLELPAGEGHAYVGGEMHAVAAVRDALVGRGMPPEAISAKPYWRAQHPNADHGEPDRE